MLDTARFDHLQRIARSMAMMAFLPAHLRGESPEQSTANCFRVVNQALRWGFDPYSVCDETYVVSGKLGYQGKLVAAVINSKAGLAGGLRCIYNQKAGDDRAIVVFGSAKPIPPDAFALLQKYADTEDAAAHNELLALGILPIRLSVGQAKTSNKMWTADPQQKLWYSGATKWARRHRPEVLLGVMTDDDLERAHVENVEPLPVGRVSFRGNDGDALRNGLGADEPSPARKPELVGAEATNGHAETPPVGDQPGPSAFQQIEAALQAAPDKAALNAAFKEARRRHHELTADQIDGLNEAYSRRKAELAG